MNQIHQNSKLFLLITMGMLSALGPFVTDFYLPAFPAIRQYFSTTESMIQLSLTTGMLGLGVGQLILGPVSDKYGRKYPILSSLLLFIVATLGCIFAPGIGLFIVFRFFQGIAGAGGVVISKSVAADLYQGNELTRFFSMLMIVNGLAPIVAPVFGSLVIKVTSWRGIFVALLILGFILLAVSYYLKESLAKEKRITGSLFSSFSNFGPIFRNKHFMYYVMAQTSALTFLFAYIAASPFIFQEHYHLDPIVYGICFGINAFGIMAGSRLVTLFNEKKALLIGGGGLLVTALFTVSVLSARGGIGLCEFFLFLQMLFMGLILPTTTSLGLDLERRYSGSASAIMGFLPFLAGSIVSPLVGMGNMIYSTGFIIFICCSLALLFILLAVNKNEYSLVAEEAVPITTQNNKKR
jgi:drug resistance transporter, Bcr/CflA subfamily